jgi:hypothetical protein
MYKFLAIKLKSSCKSENIEDKEKVQKEIKEVTGIDVPIEEIKLNEGLRTVAKLFLNSLWGKFGQKLDYTKTEYIDKNNLDKYYKLWTDDRIEFTEPPLFLDKDLIFVSYKTKNEFVRKDFNTNPYIACFTTINARLRLYNMMDKLGKRICYCDTDSIIYIEDEYAQEVVSKVLGTSLGQFTDECDGGYMKYFAGMAPKDYGYDLFDKYNNPKEFKSKVKGFRFDAEFEGKMSKENRENLIKRVTSHIVKNQTKFHLTDNHDIIVSEEEKIWSFSFDKRAIKKVQEDWIDSFPFGY